MLLGGTPIRFIAQFESLLLPQISNAHHYYAGSGAAELRSCRSGRDAENLVVPNSQSEELEHHKQACNINIHNHESYRDD